MRIDWILAIFAPYEISAPQTFARDNMSNRPESDLASILIGRSVSWEYNWADKVFDTDGTDKPAEHRPDNGVVLVGRAISSDNRRKGTAELVQYVRNLPRDIEEPARSVTLSLIACAASGLQDDYQNCFRLLNASLSTVNGHTTPERLCTAILLQQRALRKLDCGDRTFIQDASAALDNLNLVDLQECMDFELNGVTSLSMTRVIRNVLNALRTAIWSLLPTILGEEDEPKATWPTLDERIKARRSEYLLTIDRDSANEYSRWLSDLYDSTLRTTTRFVIGRSSPDLHLQVFALELIGHSKVFSARKDSAMMSIMRDLPNLNGREVAECMRLLRQAGADDELQLFLEKVTGAGPLSSLLIDTHRIQDGRIASGSLRPGEMMVIAATADVMSTNEAVETLKIILSVIEKGGPSNPPRRVQVESKRQEYAWYASAALAITAGASELVAQHLHDHLSSERILDELWDRVYARTVRRLDWKSVSPTTMATWRVQVEEWSGPSDSSLLNAMQDILQIDPVAIVRGSETSSLGSVAEELNRYFRAGLPVPDNLYHDAASRAKIAMASIASNASRGAFSSGGVQPAELAAHLLVRMPDSSLWKHLLNFLTDTAVARDDRTRAFDVLATRSPTLPDDVRLAFDLNRLTTAMHHSGSGWFSNANETSPYPACMRFAYVYGFITDDDAFLALAQMSVSVERDTREEASRIVSLISRSSTAPWVRVLALQLSHDKDFTVKRRAVRALISAAEQTGDLGDITARRLLDMLDEDGVAIPLSVLNELSSAGDVALLAAKINDMIASHPSKRVRDQAARLTGLRRR